MGLGNIFNPNEADFYGVLELLTDSSATTSVANRGPNLYVDRVVAKSIINVTQFGKPHETRKLRKFNYTKNKNIFFDNLEINRNNLYIHLH